MSGLNLQKEEGLVELNKQLIADVSCMSENANISTGERIIPKTLSDDESLKVKNSYLEKIGGKERKYHAFKASDTGPNTAQMTQPLKGDLLKNRILAEYADLLNNAENDEKLEKVIDDIKKTPEYEILRKGQGIVTRLFGLKTTSLEVLENMLKERLESLKNKHKEQTNYNQPKLK